MPEITEHQPNRIPWLALLLALIAIGLNVGFFVGSPAQHALPWLSLLCGVAALFLSAIGVWRAYSQPQLYKGRISSSIIAVVSILVCALLTFATLESRSLPSSSAAPQVGQKAPDFTLPDTQGKEISLNQLLNSNNSGTAIGASPKAVLLVFYRGYWWPFCNLELRGIQKDLKEFEAAGVQPVAISVDAPEVSRNLAGKTGYTFPILSDSSAEVIRRYNLLHKGGGPGGTDIARPAEFLVDKSGVVRWVNFTEDIRLRAKADEMLAASKAIQQ